MLLNVRLHRCALLLALAAMLLRAMIPSGFMLGREAGGGDLGLVFCSAASVAVAPFAPAAESSDPAKFQAGGHASCAFALSALFSPPPAPMAAVLLFASIRAPLPLIARTVPLQRSYPRPPSQAPPQHS